MKFAEIKEMAKSANDNAVVVKELGSKLLGNGSYVPDFSTTSWSIVENREPQKGDKKNIQNGYLKMWTVENFKTWAYKF